MLSSLAACGDPAGEAVSTPPPDLGIEAPSDGGGQEPSDGGGAGEEEPPAQAPDNPAPDPADYAGMDENTPEGAEQAFRYYIAAVMWAHQTGDSSPLSELQSRDCTSCDEFMETFRELETHGELCGEFTLNDIDVGHYDSDVYDFVIIYDFTTPHDHPKNDFSGRVNIGELEYLTVGGLEWDGERWIVHEITAEWGDDVFTE